MKRWIWSLACLLLSACGGAEPGPIALELDMRRLPLPAEITSAELILFAGDVDCDAVRLSGFDRDGVYNQSLTVRASEENAEAELFNIVAGIYTPVVWAFSAPAAPFAFACAEAPILIEEGHQTRLTLALEPF